MPNYQLNKPWGKVEDATDHPNVFATMSGSSGNYTSDLSGAQIYALLQENPKQVIFLKDTNGRACPLTTPPTSGSSSLKFSILIGTTLYEYTIASGGNGVSVSTTNVSASSSASEVFIINISGSTTYTMDVTWSAISTAISAKKVILAFNGTDRVYYNCGDPSDDGITLTRLFWTSEGAKMDAFVIDSEGTITYSGVSTLSAENAVRYSAQTLSDGQKKQARDNIEATRKVTIEFYKQSGNIVCAPSLSAMITYLNNGYVVEGKYLNRYYAVADRDVDHLTFVSPCLPTERLIKVLTVTDEGIGFAELGVLLSENQSSKTPSMTTPIGVDSSGKLWVEATGGLTDGAKNALLACFNNVAWATPDGQSLVDDLESALYPEVHLTSITAAYDQDRPIYDTDSLDLVKLDLVVTANYSDGTSEVLDDEDYTLSGTLTAGTSTITVSYGGKTDTIEVIVTESYLPAEYQAVEWVAPDSFAANAITGYIDTGITPTVNTGIEMKLAATSANPERNFFGIRQAQSGVNNAFLLQVYSADRKFGYARFGSSVQTASFDNNFHKFVLKTDEVSVDDVAYTLAAPASQTITGQTFRIFGVYVYASSSATYIWQSGGSQKVQYLKIWEDGELVREYVACYRKSDNVIGFYDRVSHTFKTNEGTGSFTKGSNITV